MVNLKPDRENREKGMNENPEAGKTCLLISKDGDET